MRAPVPLVALALVTMCAGASRAHATTVLALDLAALETRAERIFVGTVEHVVAGHDAGRLPVTWTTFRVDEPLKGVDGSRFTVKQLRSGDTPGAIARVPSLPAYAVGEKLLLFLHADSALGFTSPVGLSQGCFRIAERDGQAVVINDAGNASLGAAERRAPTRPAGPLPLASIVDRVKALGAARVR